MRLKKAFSMLEMIVVVTIVGLIMYYAKSAFSYKNVESVKFDTCYIHTYSKVTKFMQDALLQKMVLSGENYEKVDLYSVKFDVTNQKLLFNYSGNKQILKEMNFDGTGTDNINDCWTRSYFTKLSGYDLKIDINPGLQSNINKKAINLYTGSSTSSASLNYTGTIMLLFCDREGLCKEKYKFNFIPSTYIFTTQYCMKLNINTGKCNLWSN